jgi:hypothetical protein
VKTIHTAQELLHPLKRPESGSLKVECLGMELNPAFVDVIVTRWQNLTGKLACLDTGETYDSVATSRA